MEPHLFLTRYLECNGTMGILRCSLLPRELHTLELPWKDNQQLISRIPAGTYEFVPHGWNGEPVDFPKTWCLIGVPNRENVLIHIGNWIRNTKGCILAGLGASITTDRIGAVQQSGPAIDMLRKYIGERKGKITIIDAF